jgi:hypothetical protein
MLKTIFTYIILGVGGPRTRRYETFFGVTMKLSRAASRVRWLKVDETDVSRTISLLILREMVFIVT